MMEVTFTQNTIEYILLILVRIASFMSVAPFFGQPNTPVRLKLGFSIFVSVLLFYTLPAQTVEYSTVFDFAALILKESIAGLLLGFSVYICNMIINFTCKIIDMEIGMSMSQVFDHMSHTQDSITGTFYSYLIFLLMIVSNMHLYLLGAIVDSFTLIPIGGIKLGNSMYDTVIGFTANYFIIGFRIALPVFGTIILLNCVLGIMAKVAPQMNMFAVGMQLKVMTGLFVIFVTMSLLPIIANFIFDQMKSMLTQMMRGMM